ncbi:9943_t:CDS:2, partial [Funneliformis geosporum]
TAGEFQGKTATKIGKIGVEDENWSIADNEPVDNASVAFNARGGLPVIIIASTVFGQLMQGDMSVEQFFTRIKKD